MNSTSIPQKHKFANIFRPLAQISYWVHLVLGVTSGIILGLLNWITRE
jgi:hypothetical protein